MIFGPQFSLIFPSGRQPIMQNESIDRIPSKTTLCRSVSRARLVLFPIAIGLGLSLVISVVRWAQSDEARWFMYALDGMQYYLASAALTLMAMAITGLCLRPSVRTVVLTLTAMLFVAFGLSRLIRLDSFHGNRTPRFVWRWEPTAEERMGSYLANHREPIRTDREIAAGVFEPTADDFPGLMGQHRIAKRAHARLDCDWTVRSPKLLWSHPVGLGWSSFAVVGGAAITMEQRGDRECVVCYDLRSGVELWSHGTLARFQSEHGDGPRSTPTIHSGRVYACGATGIVVCLDLSSGELVWEFDAYGNTDSQAPYFGWSCSPLVVGRQLIVTPGIVTGGSMLSLDCDTGVERWRSGDDATSYASPMHAELCGTSQLLSFNGEGLRSLNEQGEGLWFHPWRTQGESRVNVAQPWVVEEGDMERPAEVLISSGYDMGTSLLRIARDEQGGKFEQGWTVETVWTSKALKSKLSNFVVHGEHVYGLDNGLLTCIRLSDGERVWKRGRYGHGQVLLVDDKLLIQVESGEIAIVAAQPDAHRELARWPTLTEKTWNHPALAGNILVVRNDREAAAFEMPTTSDASLVGW